MRAAPPVDYPLAGDGLWSRCAAALAAGASAVPFLWLAWHLRNEGVTSALVIGGVAALGAVTAAAAVWASHCRTATRAKERLRWDGAGWRWSDGAGGSEALQAVSAPIDVGQAMLLHGRRATGRALWLPVERRGDPGAWHALRVATMQRQRPSPEPADSAGVSSKVAP
jgi:hypothetical protein